MFKETAIEMFERELVKLKEEVGLYNNEDLLWQKAPGISNSAGNLCLHLVGNLNHFIGATIGNTGYARDRDREFIEQNVPREKLLRAIDETIVVLKQSLQNLSETDFAKEYPLMKHDQRVSTLHMLIHLLAHLNYHLGQINYHRRLLA